MRCWRSAIKGKTTTPAEYLWLGNGTRCLVRQASGRAWIKVDAPDPSALGVLGLSLRLTRPAKALRLEPDQCLAPRGLRFPMFAMGIGPAVFFVLFLCLLAVLPAIGASPPPLVPDTDSAWALGQLCIGFLGSLWLIRGIEAALLREGLRGNAPVAFWGLMGPTSEPAAWIACNSRSVGTVALALPFAFALASSAAGASLGWYGPGALAASILQAILVTCPLRRGPFSRLLAGFAGVDDLPTALQWTLAGRLLSKNNPLRSRGWGMLGLLGFLLPMWFWASAETLSQVALGIPEHGPAGLAFSLGAAGVGMVLGVGALAEVVVLMITARALLVRPNFHEFEPDASSIARFRQDCALLCHVPQLAQVRWTWIEAAPGTLLVEKGAEDRRFYWLAQGRVRVLGRDASGGLKPLATLMAGSGFGERTLLEGGRRSADVLVREPAVAACLESADLADLTEEQRRQLRDFVLASQAFDQNPECSGFPPADKERWLRAGTLVRYKTGDLVVREGDDDHWMALVVEGSARVERAWTHLAKLGPSQLVGEMSFLTKGHREATVIASTDLCLCRWEAGWLEEEIQRMGLRASLAQLAQHRRGGAP